MTEATIISGYDMLTFGNVLKSAGYTSEQISDYLTATSNPDLFQAGYGPTYTKWTELGSPVSSSDNFAEFTNYLNESSATVDTPNTTTS